MMREKETGSSGAIIKRHTGKDFHVFGVWGGGGTPPTHTCTTYLMAPFPGGQQQEV